MSTGPRDPVAGSSVDDLLKLAPPKPAGDAPPTDRPKKTKTSTPASRATSARQSPLDDRLTTMFVSLGSLVMVVDRFDGETIVAGSPALAGSLDRLARQNPKIRAALERMLSGGAWGEVVVAAGAIIIPIAMHHDLIPSIRLPGLGEPETPAAAAGNGQVTSEPSVGTTAADEPPLG